jgi:hypothetical protein
MATIRNLDVSEGDWESRSSQFALSVALRGGTLAPLLTQLLRCLATGQIRPETLGTALSSLLDDEAATWPKRADDLCRGFLRSLEHEGAALEDEQRQFLEQLERLARGSVTALDLRREASRSRAPSRKARELRLAGLYYDLMGGLFDLVGAGYERYLRDVLATALPPALAGGDTLELSAGPGELTSARLRIEGDGQRSTVVRCAVTDVRRLDGVGPAFLAPFELVPAVFLLEPGEGLTVEVRVELDVKLFEPDVAYVGSLSITPDAGSARRIPLRLTAARKQARLREKASRARSQA